MFFSQEVCTLFLGLGIYNILSILDISNTWYLELCPNSNKTIGPFSTNSSGVTTRFLKLSISWTYFSGPLRVRDIESWLYILCSDIPEMLHSMTVWPDYGKSCGVCGPLCRYVLCFAFLKVDPEIIFNFTKFIWLEIYCSEIVWLLFAVVFREELERNWDK